MESDRAVIGMLILVLLIVLSNFVMYAIARGMVKGGDSHWINALRNSFRKPLDGSSNKPMDELRKRVEELEKGRKEGG